ncbi:hypothetical protein FOCC_FOCC014921 [Frankliniella occidentalis]|nr:hypothetical protein FOCC_FOCC014921 [Frankliniella occidentalis]
MVGSSMMLNTKLQEEETVNHDLLDLCDALDQDETTNEGRKCLICIQQGYPTFQSAHQCAKCGKPVHLFGCSTENPCPTKEEGYGGSDRICWPCYDNLQGTHANISSSSNISSPYHFHPTEDELGLNPGDKEYICFGCQQPRVRRISKVPKSLGRAFYACPAPLNSACKKFMWAPVRALKTTASNTNAIKHKGVPAQSHLIQNYFLSESKCTVCFNLDSSRKVKCCNCCKQVHFDNCSFASGTEERLCKNCFCLLCRSANLDGHKCLCPVCQRSVISSRDKLCYRCERLVHDNCSEEIRAPELNNDLRYICRHCFSAMATGVSNSMRSELTGNKLLSDEHMARASVILSAQFGKTIDGLCAPLAVTYGDKVDNANYYPTKAEGTDYVQIMNTGRKHWVAAIFKKGSQDVTVLDSMRSLSLSGHTKIQIAMVCREEKKNTITVTRPPCKQQPNARDCGVFAIAFAVEFCFSNTSDFVDYNPSAMRPHLLQCLEAGSFTQFPRLNQTRQKKIKDDSLSETFEILCTCRLPSSFDDEMVMCEKCSKWYHNSCAGLDGNNTPDAWYCLECSPLPMRL